MDYILITRHKTGSGRERERENLNLNLNDYVEVPRSLVLYDVGGGGGGCALIIKILQF